MRERPGKGYQRCGQRTG